MLLEIALLYMAAVSGNDGDIIFQDVPVYLGWEKAPHPWPSLLPHNWIFIRAFPCKHVSQN
jgi:hypothetical protein